MSDASEDTQDLQDALRRQRETADSYVRFSSFLVQCQLMTLLIIGLLWLLTGDKVLGLFTGILCGLAVVGVCVRWRVGQLRKTMH